MSWTPLDWTAGPFLTLYITLAVIVFSLGFWLRSRIGPADHSPVRLSPFELACLAGGPSRLGDAALFSLLSANAAIVASKDHTITVTDRAELNTLIGQPTGPSVQPSMTRAQFQVAIKPLILRVRRRLQDIGYCPTEDQMGSFRLIVLPVVAFLLGFGAAKVSLGMERQHPVGFLVILLLLTVGAGIALATRPNRTRAGADALKNYQASHDRAARAPLGHELLLALAISGPIILSGTPYESVYAASRIMKNGTDGGGCGGGSCGGGDGGGCGGCS